MSKAPTASSGKNLLLVAGVGVAALGTAYVAYKMLNSKEQPKQQQSKPSSSSSSNENDKVQKPTDNITPTPVPLKSTEKDSVVVYDESTLTVDTSKWKEHKHEELGIRFKLPPTYKVTMGLNEFESFVFNIEPTTGESNVKMMILVEDQAERVPAEAYLQQGILAVSLIGSSVQVHSESSVIASGLEGAEMEFFTTTHNPQQNIRTWALVVTSTNRAISIQYVTADPNNFDVSLIKNIVRTLKVTEKKHDVSLRVHTKEHNLSISLPNYRYHIIKPATSEVILSAAAATGSIVTETIDISTSNTTSNQFIDNYKKKYASNSSFTPIESTKLASDTITAQLFSYNSRFDQVDYRLIDAIFEHNQISYLVSARCLPENFASFKSEALKTISSIQFNERQNLTQDVLTYRNNTHKFTYDTSVDVVVKQHSIQPIVTFLTKPQIGKTASQLDNNLLIAETQIACKETAPIFSPTLLREVVMLELQEEQHSILKLISESKVTIDGVPALQITYSMKEPLTGQNVVFVQTAFLADESHVMSIKSWTVEAVFSEQVHNTFTKEHSSFKFTK